LFRLHNGIRIAAEHFEELTLLGAQAYFGSIYGQGGYSTLFYFKYRERPFERNRLRR
jgi:hypothetical protein